MSQNQQELTSKTWGRSLPDMQTPPEPLPDWLTSALHDLEVAFGADPGSRKRMVMAFVPGELGTGRHGLRVYAGFEGKQGIAGPQFLLIQGQRITAESLRQIPMAQIERIYLGETVAETDPRTLPKLERAGRPPESFSKLVAQHYLAWQQMDPHPAKRMAEESGHKQATVHSWIREARLRGVLPSPERRARAKFSPFPISDAAQAAVDRERDRDKEEGANG